MTSKTNKLRVFIDGQCYLCHFEGRLIKRADRSGLIEIVNIASPTFDRKTFPDRPLDRYLQVQVSDGHFVEGPQAFAEIYKLLPRMRWLGRILALPVVAQLAWIPYFIFAHLRPYLPKRKSCEI